MNRCNNCDTILDKCQHCGADSCHGCGGKIGFCQQEPTSCKKNKLAWSKAKLRSSLSRFISDPNLHNSFAVENAMDNFSKIHIS